MEVARKMAQVRTPEEFLRVFFPVDSVKSRWTKMVNESVQNAWRTGRTQGVGQADRPTFTPETAEQEMEEVGRHGVSVQCREPLPVLIDMYEELNLTRGGLVYVYPECTKVRRCEGSGCCQDGAPCVGKETTRQNITKSFIIMTVRPDSKHKDARYVKHSVYADTECVCKDRSQVPLCQPTICSQTMTFDEVTCRCLCNKPCPRPYIQDPDTCDCRCDQKDSGCKKIKRSRRRMAATECTCVMDNRCLQPACNKGYTFSTTSCKCSANGSKQRNPNRKRDREQDRNGRTDEAQLNLPYPPPPLPRGRTNINPVLLPFDSSSSEGEEPGMTGGGHTTFLENSSSGSDDQDVPASPDELIVSWASEASPSEDCGSSCRSQTVHQGNDNGSGGGAGGDLLDF
ncbi:uncharacterized protein LOC119727516 isoform X2 [Patiria miniata]|nr:uncharacterized protein LOC119727516 isoform X2 [Patiria miniata]